MRPAPSHRAAGGERGERGASRLGALVAPPAARGCRLGGGLGRSPRGKWRRDRRPTSMAGDLRLSVAVPALDNSSSEDLCDTTAVLIVHSAASKELEGD
ncbi:putative protein SIX6OS1 [Chlorella sorokiniana]|uniref:Uncharacterized protein n=1 Tax=Chlorella sorokiniana TaxID=3076 RepID=A0A2P6THP8_CHLSO|nr:putative protein SIX6OS1 [Chlorella sorokiniana]|eukprot:PRW33808.1 putative protein SIX6OS1 [Chlorella sorokiniana]